MRTTQPTLGRHVEELEKALAVSLFTRAPDGLKPTAAALAVMPMAEAMEAAAAAIVRTADAPDDVVAGAVRITASEVMGAEVLPPLLAAIRREHPNLVLELALNNRSENLVRREADIAVRMARPQQNAIVAKKLGTVTLGFFAHRDYLEQQGRPRTLDDLMTKHVIGFDRDDRSARSIAPKGLRLDRNLFAVRSDSDLAQQAALRAGLGIGVMQHRLAALHPELEPVLAKDFQFALEVWLAMHEDQRASRLMRTVYDALAAELAGWLKGTPTPTGVGKVRT